MSCVSKSEPESLFSVAVSKHERLYYFKMNKLCYLITLFNWLYAKKLPVSVDREQLGAKMGHEAKRYKM